MKPFPTIAAIAVAFGAGAVFGARSPYTAALRPPSMASGLSINTDLTDPTGLFSATIPPGAYEQVQNGMTLEQVKGLLGDPSSITNAESGGIVISSYTWMAGDRTVGITFQDGKVIGKVDMNTQISP